WKEEHDALKKWTSALLINVRRELGVRHFRSLHMDPSEERPEPPVKQPKKARLPTLASKPSLLLGGNSIAIFSGRSPLSADRPPPGTCGQNRNRRRPPARSTVKSAPWA